jgi:hypothetical protein
VRSPRTLKTTPVHLSGPLPRPDKPRTLRPAVVAAAAHFRAWGTILVRDARGIGGCAPGCCTPDDESGQESS